MGKGDDWPTLEVPGKLALRLASDTNWIRRRVETVSLLDSSQVERSVSLDIDLGAIRRLVAEVMEEITERGRTAVAPSTILIPLTLLPKTLLLDFDVRSADDGAISLVTSDEDSSIAQAALAALAAQLDDEQDRAATLPQVILDNLFRIARAEIRYGEDEVLKQRPLDDAQIDSWELEGGQAADQETWRALFDDTAFVELLSSYTINFAPMIRVGLTAATEGDVSQDPSDDHVIIKYRHMERLEPSDRPPWRTRLALDAYKAFIKAPSLGSGCREHLRFVAPSGLFLRDFYIPPPPPNQTPTAPAPAPAAKTVHGPRPPDIVEVASPVTGLHYNSRLTPERGIIYTGKDVRSARPLEALALLRPRTMGFARTAQWTVLSAALLLVAGAVVQLSFHGLTDVPTGAGPVAALLLVVPSTMSAFLAKDSEHELLSYLLRVPRLAVAASAAATVIAAGCLLLQMKSWYLGAVWAVAAVIGLAVFWLLHTIAQRSSDAYKDSSVDAHRTMPMEL